MKILKERPYFDLKYTCQSSQTCKCSIKKRKEQKRSKEVTK